MSATRIRGKDDGTKTRRRRLFDYVPGTYRPRRVRQGVIFGIFALLFCWIFYTKPYIPYLSSATTSYTADVANATDIFPGQTPVRVHGIDVGTVSGLQSLGPNRGAQITLAIQNNSGIVLHNDASFVVRWRTLLGGNVFIDLNPGSSSSPDLGQTTIPVSHSSGQVEIDQVLTVLPQRGRRALQSMAVGFDQALSDPHALAGTVSELQPSMQQIGPAVSDLNGTQVGDLGRLVTSSNRVLTALGRNEHELASLILNGNSALGVSAAHAAEMGDALTQAPGALAQTQATMVRLRTTLNIVDPLAQRLLPGAQQLAPAAGEARAMLADAMPLLRRLVPLARNLSPSVSSLGRTAQLAPSPIQNLNSTVDRGNSSFVPWLGTAAPYERGLKVYETVGPAVAGADGALANGNQYGVYATFHGGAGVDAAINSPCQLQLFAAYTSTTNGLADCNLLVSTLGFVLGGKPTSQLTVSGEPAKIADMVRAVLSKKG